MNYLTRCGADLPVPSLEGGAEFEIFVGVNPRIQSRVEKCQESQINVRFADSTTIFAHHVHHVAQLDTGKEGNGWD